jgi:hypothetical protein
MSLNPEHYFMHKDIIDNREEDVPHFSKAAKTEKKEIVFDHANSVFSQWKPDAPASIDKQISHDMIYWKLWKFLKNEHD